LSFLSSHPANKGRLKTCFSDGLLIAANQIKSVTRCLKRKQYFMSSAIYRLSPFSIVFPFCHSNRQYGKSGTLFIAC